VFWVARGAAGDALGVLSSLSWLAAERAVTSSGCYGSRKPTRDADCSFSSEALTGLAGGPAAGQRPGPRPSCVCPAPARKML